MNFKSIWIEKQNKPTLVVRDIKLYLSKLGYHTLNKNIEHIIYTILLRRGVFKWLNVRRLLIKQKNVWKDRIRNAHSFLLDAKANNNSHNVGYWRGYLAAYTEARKEIRAMCHSERWTCPDFDKEANKWLSKQTDIDLKEIGLD